MITVEITLKREDGTIVHRFVGNAFQSFSWHAQPDCSIVDFPKDKLEKIENKLDGKSPYTELYAFHYIPGIK